MSDTGELLYRACRDFVNEQSEGEWSEDQIASDARKMAAFIDEVRPGRPKLNTDVTPEIVAMLDGSAAREAEARWAAEQAFRMASEEMRTGGEQHALADLVKFALGVRAEARRQIAEAQKGVRG